MQLSQEHVKCLFEAGKQVEFAQFGFNMLVTRLKGIYINDPSEAVLQDCSKELNTFLNKYSIMMNDDLEKISGILKGME